MAEESLSGRNFKNSPQRPPVRTTSRTIKFLVIGGISIAVLGLLLCGGILVYVRQNSVQLTDPVEIRNLTDEILEVELPPGFTPEQGQIVGLAFATVRNVMYLAPGDGRLLITQTIMDGNLDAERAEAGFQAEAERDNANGRYKIENVKTKTVTIAGSDRKFAEASLVGEKNGKRFVRISGLVEVGKGTTYLSLLQAEESYDWPDNRDDVEVDQACRTAFECGEVSC